MRKFAIATVALLAACGYTEDSFYDDFEAEANRISDEIADACDIEADEEEGEEVERTDCTEFDADKAKECIDGLKDISYTECTTEAADFQDFPAACADACIISDDDDDDDDTDAADA